MSCDDVKENPIHKEARCSNCAHAPVCGKFATMVATNEQFLEDAVFALTMNPIDVNYVARHCKEFILVPEKHNCEKTTDEDLR